MLRVAIDTTPLYVTRAGTARYVRGLLRGLREECSPDEITEIAWPVQNFVFRQPRRALKTAYRELIWAPYLATQQIRQSKCDLLHSTSGYFVRPPRGCPNVVTLHDLALLRYPERFRRWHRISGHRRLRRVAQADRVICISRFTADEAMQLLGLPAKKIEVVYNGGSSLHVEAHESEEPAGIPEEFFLFVGSLEPGKNLKLLRDVYAIANEAGTHLPPLVIVGARWPNVASEGLPPGDWLYLGQQSDLNLASLYRHAVALVFPSLYEGFGLPIIEAQLNGCPVICSPLSSLPEVAGSGALFAQQTPKSYLEMMRCIIKDNQRRTALTEAGYRNASRFDWNRAAIETLTVYHSVV